MSTARHDNPAPRTVYVPDEDEDPPDLSDPELNDMRDELYGIVRRIHDPEHDHTLEELRVVQKAHILVLRTEHGEAATIHFTPTVPHCSLATLIGLCIRAKITRTHPNLKLDIRVREGTHQSGAEISKQINDKERVFAALENPSLRETVERLIATREE